jgi:hypothetical protein
MRLKQNLARGFLWIILAALPVLGKPLLEAQGQRTSNLAVVVNKDTPVTDLSLDDVRKIFLGDRQYWTAKLPVVLLIRAPMSWERGITLRIIYQMDETQYQRYWIAKIFRAESATPPKIAYSNGMAHELTATIPGAISIMDAADVPPGVKVVRIDGHLPGDPGYPLK